MAARRIPVALLLLLCPLVRAQDRTPAQAADEVLAAAPDAMAGLAARDIPDPWLVADELCARGKHDAAAAFARATGQPEPLVAYVASRRGAAVDPAVRQAVHDVTEAMHGMRFDDVVARTASLKGDPDTVARVFLVSARGFALLNAGRAQESARVLEAAVAGARKLGWTRREGSALVMLGRLRQFAKDRQGALAALERAVALFTALDDGTRVTQALIALGNVHSEAGDHDAARAAYERGRKIADAAGDRVRLGILYENLALIHDLRGEHDEALELAERSLALREALEDPHGVARMLGRVASAHESVGRYEQALALVKRALAMSEELGDTGAVARSLSQIGSILRFLGRYEEALLYLERGVKLAQQAGDTLGEAAGLANTSIVLYRLSDFGRALAHAKRSLALFTEAGDVRGQAFALGHVGNVAYALGDYPEALRSHERSLVLRRKVGDAQGMLASHVNIGNVYASTGDFARALVHQERALALAEQVGDPHGLATALGNIGNVHHESGDHRTALTYLERAVAVREKTGDVPGMAATLSNLAVIHEFLDEPGKALRVAQRALKLFEQLGNRAQIASSRGNVATLKLKHGDQRGLAELEQAIREARWLRATPVLVRFLDKMALHQLERGEPRAALDRAREASREVQQLFAGLGGELSASVREKHAGIYGIGALAAMELDQLAEAWTFVEDGRAGALLEALGGRQALAWADLPAELRRAESQAQAAHAAARENYEAALSSGDRKAVRKAAEALDAAREGLRTVTERIQRDAMREASVFYPRAAPLEEVQRGLRDGEAFVLYGFCLDQLVAFVLTREDARMLPVGPAMEIALACEQARFVGPDADPAAAHKTLKSLLVEPLGLEKETTRVLVSPDGPLGYLPFGLLFDRPVALTPSGTTHVLLRREARTGRGQGVLALGDPDYAGVSPEARSVYYRGRALAKLPATRTEAETVGDTALTGAKANEAALREALARPEPWRAVHFACHGLVNPDRPTLSALALSATQGEDGFLTCLEVLRLKVQADLVVLSACETATGRIVHGEGIVGLTRAFMFAGAPRVIVSLWKVDDEATRALMVKFYELARKHPTAEALKQAQEHVAAQAKWSHPYYWAAWQLWGLPD